MRDAIRDQRYVRCPNASTLAYGTYRAQLGSWIVWRQDTYEIGAAPDAKPIGTYTGIGRMIARIVYSAGFPGTDRYEGAETIRNWIEVLALHENLHHASIRWIDPSWVREVHPTAPDLAKFLEWFATVDVRDHGRIRALAEYGCLRPNQAKDQPSWDFSEALVRGDEYVTRARNAGKVF